MEHQLKDKTILVAGAGGLLGSHLVPEIINQGGTVIAADIDFDAMRDRLKKQGVNLDSEQLILKTVDVTSEADIRKLFNHFECLDGAVNTCYPRNKAYGAHFFDVSLDSFNENVSMHLGSAFLFIQQCAAYFKQHQRIFSLVNISSVYGVVAPKFNIYNDTKMTMPVEYAAIKSAILHLNKYAVAYVNDSRFRVNSISPGGIFDHQPESFLKAYKNKTHGSGMLSPEDMNGSILFLLSDQSKFVTGQNIIVDDGFTL